MAERTNNGASYPLTPVGIEAMLHMHRPAFTAMLELNNRVYEGIAALNKELASLANRRLKEDLAVPQKLAECKTVAELCQVYAQFFKNAYSRYQSELDQLTRLNKSIAENILQPLQPRP